MSLHQLPLSCLSYLLTRLPPILGLRFIRQVASALLFMHQHQFAHKDLKAENLIMSHKDDDAPDNKIKVVDFGSSGPTTAPGPKKLLGITKEVRAFF